MREPIPAPVSIMPVSIMLGSERRDVVRLHAWLDGVFRSALVPPDLNHDLRLCLEEVVTNIMMHGYHPGTVGPIEIRLRRRPGCLVAEITDAAPAFDPTRVAPPAAPASLAEAEPGGLGLILVRRYASSWRYRRRHGRNQLTLGFRIYGES